MMVFLSQVFPVCFGQRENTNCHMDGVKYTPMFTVYYLSSFDMLRSVFLDTD